MFKPNDIKRIGRAVRYTEKVPSLKGQQQPQRGTVGTGDSREVSCTMDGGTDGNPASPSNATYTYTIVDGITGTTLATHVRVVCQRFLATYTVAATAGTAIKITSSSSPFYNSGLDGTTFPIWYLTWTDEKYRQKNDCVTGDGSVSSSATSGE